MRSAFQVLGALGLAANAIATFSHDPKQDIILLTTIAVLLMGILIEMPKAKN